MTDQAGGLSYDVRIWKLERYEGSRVTSHTVRWRVSGNRHARTFRTVKLAEGFRAELLVAARKGTPFDIASGLPATLRPAATPRTWLEHAMAYVETKWPHASPRHRKGIAEALTDITTAITRQTRLGAGAGAAAAGAVLLGVQRDRASRTDHRRARGRDALAGAALPDPRCPG